MRYLAKAGEFLAGGVNSPVRSFNKIGIKPVYIKRGAGSKVYDYKGKRYIDYLLYWGSIILGHKYKPVIRDVKNSLNKGFGFGTTNDREIELARIIKKAIPFAEKLRFVNSGTEAVMSAVRLARGFTKRDIVVKFTNSYHGHADYLLAKGGSGLATLRLPFSNGIPDNYLKDTIVIKAGDEDALNNIFRKHGVKIAAVLVEPVGGNYGVIPPDINFLQKLRRITDAYRSVLIFDEVITGFRFSFSSVAQSFGIKPDLICLGKIIGGGLPIGAYAGPAKIMDNLAPEGKVYQASTFSGNPIVMQAGISSLSALAKLKRLYPMLDTMARFLSSHIEDIASIEGVDLRIPYFGGMFSFNFRNSSTFREFYKLMLKKGVLFAPSEFEANFISFAHSKKDIEDTISASRWALKELRKRRMRRWT
ncbi:MAG: aminotransferase class III-fold pyridoxal phosphate-dependent enzyme [Candidatus Omnitrophota bacterium]|nr:MAG: aminotransferase class III-fold pyridoxal phosphate-dependent enzyme [Candidatus Omnitrophota bacterium]